MTVCTASPQAVGVERAGDGDVELHRIHVVAGAVGGGGVEDQSLLQGGQRQDVGDPVVLRSSSIWSWLSRAGAMSEGVSPPPPCGRERRCRRARQTTTG